MTPLKCKFCLLVVHHIQSGTPLYLYILCVYSATKDENTRKHFLLAFQAVAFLPHKEAEEAEQRVHESDIVGDAGDDRLLTVRTHGLNRRGLEHFSLQHCHCGRSSWRSQDGRCVTSHVDKRTGTHLSGHGMVHATRWRRVHAARWRRIHAARWRWVHATCM